MRHCIEMQAQLTGFTLNNNCCVQSVSRRYYSKLQLI